MKSITNQEWFEMLTNTAIRAYEYTPNGCSSKVQEYIKNNRDNINWMISMGDTTFLCLKKMPENIGKFLSLMADKKYEEAEMLQESDLLELGADDIDAFQLENGNIVISLWYD